MPTVNLKSYNILDTMKPDQTLGMIEEGNDSLDTFIRQTIGKEPVLSFSRTSDSPVQWIQLLQALDHQDLPGWPLLAPKVQMQKCDKCAREFYSSINYRRHRRVHRRSLNIDKDFPKNRDFLGTFWDKLSKDEAKEIVSFRNVTLEEVPGSLIVKTLTSLVRKPGFTPLPQVYVKAGSDLLDVIQARPPRFPISSEELFSILDDASEKTFMCAGTAISLQKFVFDGEAGKIGLEMKNIVACTCFLLEQKLVKAWLADKDAEALRCQKLLMEEEEAAQRRQNELLERKKLKKLRQKEQQKAKEQIDREEVDFEGNSLDSSIASPSAETYNSPASLNLHSFNLEETSELGDFGPLRELNTNEELDSSSVYGLNDSQFDTTQSNTVSDNVRNLDHHMKVNVRQVRRPSSSSHRVASNGYHPGTVHQKFGPGQRQGVHRDQKSTLTNGHKMWTRKNKAETNGGNMNVGLLGESKELSSPIQNSSDQPDQNDNRELLIGSISVRLREGNGRCQGAPAAPIDHCIDDNHLPQNKNVQAKNAKSDSGQCGTNRAVKLWRPVGKHEVKEGTREAEATNAIDTNVGCHASSNEICLPSYSANDNGVKTNSLTLTEDGADSSGLKLFSSSFAEAFLTQRWKEAIASDHVRLVLFSEIDSANRPEPPGATATSRPLNSNILHSSDNNTVTSVGTPESANSGSSKAKSKAKAGKSGRLKYIPKQPKQRE